MLPLYTIPGPGYYFRAFLFPDLGFGHLAFAYIQVFQYVKPNAQRQKPNA